MARSKCGIQVNGLLGNYYERLLFVLDAQVGLTSGTEDLKGFAGT
ncbi:MAG: hypothetical protein QXH56_07275 [Thermoprotei archaeon]